MFTQARIPTRQRSRRLYYRPRLLVLEDRTLPSFAAPISYDVGFGPSSVAVGDFNGDGIPDLAVANLGTYPNYTDGSVSVLLGRGDGTFQPARTLAAGIYASSVVVGDFNGDGILDLAVVSSGGVRILLGNGFGNFQTAPIGYLAGAGSVAVGDFNGDGYPDLAVTTSYLVVS